MFGSNHEQFPDLTFQVQFEKNHLRHVATWIGVLMIVMTVLLQFTFPVIAIFLSSIGYLPENFHSEEYLGIGNTAYLCVYAGVYAFIMGVPILIAHSKRQLFSKKFFRRTFTFGTTFLMILAAVGGCMLANIITNYLLVFLNSWGVPIPQSPQLLEPSLTSFLLCLFVIAVLPAILEEMLFRGCVLRSLRSFGDGFAILISAVLFGLMHGNIRQIPFATIVGLILGWMYVVTNSLVLPIVVHFINNALSVVMQYTAFYISETDATFFQASVIYWLVIVGVFFAVLLFIFKRPQLRLERQITALRFGEKVLSLFRSVIFIVSIALFIILTGLELMG